MFRHYANLRYKNTCTLYFPNKYPLLSTNSVPNQCHKTAPLLWLCAVVFFATSSLQPKQKICKTEADRARFAKEPHWSHLTFLLQRMTTEENCSQFCLQSKYSTIMSAWIRSFKILFRPRRTTVRNSDLKV